MKFIWNKENTGNYINKKENEKERMKILERKRTQEEKWKQKYKKNERKEMKKNWKNEKNKKITRQKENIKWSLSLRTVSRKSRIKTNKENERVITN